MDKDNCCICFEPKPLVKTCHNNHYCCKECLSQIKICHLCRSELIEYMDFIDYNILEYCDIFNIDHILNNQNILKFISLWKSSNYIRNEKQRLNLIFNEVDIQIFSSFKRNNPYSIYRGVKNILHNKSSTDITYVDKYPSSWTTDINIASKFGSHIYHIVVEPNKVLLDFSLLPKIINTLNENEVILFQGEYKCEYIDYKQEIKEKNKKIIDKTLIKHFTINNVKHINDTRKKSDPLCFNIEELKELCRLFKINYNQKDLKISYINKLVEYKVQHSL
jgi:hypothetical protein